MKNKISILFLVAITGLIFSGCKKDNATEQPFLGYNYFPLNVGSEKIYQVDSIGYLGYTFDPVLETVEIDSVHYQVKEVVESFFADNEGRQTARIVRYKRLTSSDPWEIYKVYAANRTATTAERVEDNTRYIKLVFPPKENEKWNGNSLNNDESGYMEYSFTSVNVPGNIGPLNFDSTLTVLQLLDDNLITYSYYTEQYAANTGMIYKEYNDYEYMFIGVPKIKNGFIYKETLLSFIP